MLGTVLIRNTSKTGCQSTCGDHLFHKVSRKTCLKLLSLLALRERYCTKLASEQAETYYKVAKSRAKLYYDRSKSVVLMNLLHAGWKTDSACIKNIGANRNRVCANRNRNACNLIWRHALQQTYGRRTMVESDCKPIESVMNKPLCSAPPRLQRHVLQLQKYDVEVIHCRCKIVPLGDALSRNYVSKNVNRNV